MRAHLLIRREPHYRRDAFEAGLTRAGYIVSGEPRGAPQPEDVLVIWNRYGRYHEQALKFERAGARVVVAENGAFGREWGGEAWYSITLRNPLAGGSWGDAGAARWDSLGVNICEWRNPGSEVIILAQRGIGPPGVCQPSGWERKAALLLLERPGVNVRVRAHPGERPCVPLEKDLENARCVVTWASGAAFKALLSGVPVIYGYPQWVGRKAGTPLVLGQDALNRSSMARLALFRQLSWAIWRIPEIEKGLPFKHLLASPSGLSGSTTAAT